MDPAHRPSESIEKQSDFRSKENEKESWCVRKNTFLSL